MIEVKNITKIFRKKIGNKQVEVFKADDNISFLAKDGEVLGILGPNGAGKTTLLRIISGIMSPDEGNVIIDNLNYNKSNEMIKKNIAFMSGNTKLYKDISPYELLKLCGEYYEIPNEILEKRINEISKRFNMESFLHQRIESLSTGQYQRTCIARCLVQNPKYYILDEATSGLDVISSKTILDFIKEEKQKGKCIIYSTHYMEEAENICDKLLLINKGKVVAYGKSEEILEKTNTNNIRDAFLKLIGESNE